MTSVRHTLPPPAQAALFPLEAQELPRQRIPQVSCITEPAGNAPHDRRDVFNGRLIKGLTLVGHYDIPKIEACTLVPDRLIAFSEAVGKGEPDPTAWVHGYEDDYKTERLWRSPEKYFEKLRGFAGVICPDHSSYRNMSRALKIYNVYRNQLLGASMQADGHSVIPNVRLSGRDSVPYALAGIPRRSTLAVGLHGCTRLRENRSHVVEEIRMICDFCEPVNLVVYGSAAYGVLDYPRELGIPVHVFAPDSFRRSESREAS